MRYHVGVADVVCIRKCDDGVDHVFSCQVLSVAQRLLFCAMVYPLAEQSEEFVIVE